MVRPVAILAFLVLTSTACPAMAQSPTIADLPAAARLPGLSVYIALRLVGEQTYRCGRTDALAWAWLLQTSNASLVDAEGRRIGTFQSTVAVIPPPPNLPSSWQDAEGGRVTAIQAARGMMPNGVRMWSRYDVDQHEGRGPFTTARVIVRISDTGVTRPHEPCDESHSGATSIVPYTATELFLRPQ